ncbi:hypothetical protein [Bacillus altitudinis]|uniref:hypothetical protein n=1 Tax=Bacillus altitudinis TaxID=293387 RepID=UPI00119CAAA6|nr:hypothetical protein [Bacillus altitudinis]
MKKGWEVMMMCGITGWGEFKKEVMEEDHVMNEMRDRLCKGGGDDRNRWKSEEVVLGDKGLGVVDVEGGKEGMRYRDEEDDYRVV